MKNTHKNPSQGVKPFKKRTIRLEAGESDTVGLGAHSVAKQESDFTIETYPDMRGMLGTSLEMVKIPGSDRFMGLYHLHNYGDKGCDVTIIARTTRESRDGRS